MNKTAKTILFLIVITLAAFALVYWLPKPAGAPTAENPDENGLVCIQVITPAKNIATGEIRDFPTPCDVPDGWESLLGSGIEIVQ